MSYMEIYKDDVYDLLVERDTVRSALSRYVSWSSYLRKAQKLPVRENDCGQVFVANLSSLQFESVDAFQGIYKSVFNNSLMRLTERASVMLRRGVP